jgi:glycosyltransferase involved in cell wall biosynthesis
MNKPFGICLLTDSFYPIVGGGEIHAKLLGEELGTQGCVVDVVTRRRIKDSKNKEFLNGIQIWRVPPTGFNRFGKYFMIMPAFLKLIVLRRRHRVIYVCGLRILGAVGVLVSKITGAKCILRSESCGELSGEFILDQPQVKKNKYLYKFFEAAIFLRNRILISADLFISISSAITNEYICSGVPKSKIIEIPNGIDLQKFEPATKEHRTRLKNCLKIPEKTIFTYTGKLNRGKGLELLLRVWNLIVKQNNGVHLYLVGSGDNQIISCETELRSYIKNNELQNFVTITGYVDNVHEYLQCSDCFVFPSESEAFGISIIEALACELPVITTEIDGIVDIIDHHVNGLLINVNDDFGLKNSILWFLNNRNKSAILGINGRKTVHNRYSIQAIAEKHFKTFLDIQKTV